MQTALGSHDILFSLFSMMAEYKWLRSLASCAAVTRCWSTVAFGVLWSRASLANLFSLCGLDPTGKITVYPSKESLDRFLFYRDLIRHASWHASWPALSTLTEFSAIIPGSSLLPSLTTLDLQCPYPDRFPGAPMSCLVLTHSDLQSLHISSITSRWFPTLMWELLPQKAPNLLELHLEVRRKTLGARSSKPEITNETKQAVACLLRSLKKLKRVQLSFVFQTEELLLALATLAGLDTISWVPDVVSDKSASPKYEWQSFASFDAKNGIYFGALTCVELDLPFGTSLAFLDFLQRHQSAAVVSRISLETRNATGLENHVLASISRLLSQKFPGLGHLSMMSLALDSDYTVTISDLHDLKACRRLKTAHIEVRSASSIADHDIVSLLRGWPNLLNLTLIFPESPLTGNILTSIARLQPQLQALSLCCLPPNETLSHGHRFWCLRQLALDFYRGRWEDARPVAFFLALVLSEACKIKRLAYVDGKALVLDPQAGSRIVELVQFAWDTWKVEKARLSQDKKLIKASS